ncbi:uncharacterized protein JN550_008720 [Neoarthrinium moseri]|uniref:uncharacterized protein n=1 Tax=Neoarthrinium moseri TaxID=1658444 RepID=UPI001FDCE5B0|nr:uncharacterized protein JN550_008720 [Neoarthrinium moseri]KAI1864900.1 hypothetical protein JN550_008720 [Neoarthrinium moseri]
MRPVNWPFRDVKLARLVTRPSLTPFATTTLALPTWLAEPRLDRVRSIAIAAHVNAHLVPPSGADTTSISTAPLAPRRQDLPKSYVQDAASFGKWRILLDNPHRLAVETDFDREGPARKWGQQLLVDVLGNHGDLKLWSCLLQHLQRTRGDRGVQKLWNAFWGRKSLWKTDDLPDQIFWQTILESALRLDDDKFLHSVYIYAEWMLDIHGSEWPNLYTTILSYYLRTHQHAQVLKWHIRLTPNYYPGSRAFVDLIRHFATDHVIASAYTLQSLYIASPERRLYDLIVPYLYDRGEASLAVQWRKTCVKFDDVPLFHAPSRQFLRWYQGYWPNVKLHPWESAALKESIPAPTLDGGNIQPPVSREYMNSVLGKTFGFPAKSYNDHLGSRWFGSTWVSLDTAISVVAALGVKKIGTLSLRSICQRERTPEGILSRISQLQSMGVNIPGSAFATTVVKFATVRDNELLSDLLDVDLDPSTFGDPVMLTSLMESSAASGDLRTYTLLLASRLAQAEKASRDMANKLVLFYLRRKDHGPVLRLIDDMRGAEVAFNVSTCNSIYQYIGENVRLHPPFDLPREELLFCVALCRRLIAVDVPVPATRWRKIMYQLGRVGQIDQLCALTNELVDYYSTRQSARSGFMPVHWQDVPEPMVLPLKGVSNLIGLYIPLDTPRFSLLHPLSQIFNARWQSEFVRWAFRRIHRRLPSTPLLRSGSNRTAKPVQHDIEKALVVLRKLHDCGVNVPLSKLQKTLIIRLSEIYGSTPGTKGRLHTIRRSAPTAFSLPQMKAMLDEAWGSEILPPLEELQRRMREFDLRHMRRHNTFVTKALEDRPDWKIGPGTVFWPEQDESEDYIHVH